MDKQFNHKSKAIVENQKSIVVSKMGEAERKLKLTGVSLGTGTKEDQKRTVTSWIMKYMHRDANQLRVLSVTPITPPKSQAYVLLTFLTSNDARSFESKMSNLKKEDNTHAKVYINRWTISSS